MQFESKTKSFLSRFVSDKSSKTKYLANSSKHVSLKDTIFSLRSIKSDAEIANMRKAGQTSGRAFTGAMRHSWTKEKDLAAFMDYTFKRNGCDGAAYIPVVAGGRNASIIHYTQNDHLLKKDELVLVDAGGEYGGYITDITRTWPISGKYSPAQRELYNVVLKTQRDCISRCRANSNLSLDDLHEVAEASMKDSLAQLGFDMSAKVSSGGKTNPKLRLRGVRTAASSNPDAKPLFI